MDKDLKTQIAVLTERVENWMLQTVDYRATLCKKLDYITNKVNDLPCKERKNIYDSISAQVKIMWIFLTAIILAIVVEWIKK